MYLRTLTQTTVDATHIFDGLNEFPTHIMHMRLGSFVMDPTPWLPSPIDNKGGALFRTALQWLREDREHRRELEKAGRKTRGARRDQVRTPSFTRSFGVRK
jgi:CCR4-NOT complex subunit CAF16